MTQSMTLTHADIPRTFEAVNDFFEANADAFVGYDASNLPIEAEIISSGVGRWLLHFEDGIEIATSTCTEAGTFGNEISAELSALPRGVWTVSQAGFLNADSVFSRLATSSAEETIGWRLPYVCEAG